MGNWSNGPALAVDCVIFHDGAVILVRRKYDPFKGQYALPGGAVEIGETVEEACGREMMEEIGLKIEKLRLIGVYSRPDRDPRGHTVSIAYLADADVSGLRAGSDAAAAELVDNWRNIDLAFDHRHILHDAWELCQADS
jgi:8-oxo-dGTP diphosphatase